MATFLDHPYQGTPYVSGVPVDLIMRVGAVKQARYESNVANVQAQLDQMDQYNITKDSDREVIYGKLNDTVSQLNNLAGQDLGDSRVYGQLTGLTSSLYNDPDVYTRISDNQRHNASVKEREELLKKNPDLFGETNQYVFNKRQKAWLDDPNARWSSAYTPYTDLSKWSGDQIKTMLANPDVIRQIEYYTDPVTGVQQKRGEREIEQVRAEKIAQMLSASMGSKEKNQLMIDREYQNDQLDYKQVATEIQDQAKDYRTQANDLRERIRLNVAGEGADQTLKNILEAADLYDAKAKEVLESKDVSKFYTPQKYITDYVTRLGNAWQKRKEGKLDDDFIFTEDWKLKNAIKLEQAKNRDEYEWKARLGLGADGKPLKNIASIPNDFKNNVMSLMTNGKAAMKSKEMSSLYNGSDVHEDGSFDIPVYKEDVFLDVQPTLQALGINVDAAKATGIIEFNRAYQSWIKSAEGQTAEYEKTSDGNIILSALGIPNFGGAPTHKARSQQEFLNSKKGKEAATKIKSETGLDVSDPTQMTEVKKSASDPKLIEGLMKVSTMFKNAKIGRVNVVPMDGENVFTGNDGQVYSQVLAQLTAPQLKAIFGDGWFSSPEYETLVDKGLITNTGKEDAKGNVIYNMPLVSKVKTDLNNANMDYLNKRYTNSTYAENIPALANDFTQAYSMYAGVKDMVNVPPDKLGLDARHNIGGLKNISLDQNRVATSQIEQAVAILKAQPPAQPTERIAALEVLKRLQNWDGTQPTMDTSNPTQALSTPGTPSSYSMSVKYIKTAIAANEQDSRGYQTVNKDSGALGKYQFLESTLKDIYKKDHTKTYSSFADFKKAYMMSGSLQEAIMDKWIEDFGPRVGFNPLRFAMSHFLGEQGVTDLVSGRRAWDANETGNPNATPIRYFTNFARTFNQQ
jgi:hypothetical protein